MKREIGVVYPAFPKHLERIFAGKDVFCKFVGKGPSGKGKARVEQGQKILFYSSHGNHEIVGEAKIDNLEYLSPEETISKYRERLFITPEELRVYARRRERKPDSKLLVASLKQIRKYKKSYKLKKPLTMAGMKVTGQMYDSIVAHRNRT